jgi:hypothetical protein
MYFIDTYMMRNILKKLYLQIVGNMQKKYVQIRKRPVLIFVMSLFLLVGIFGFFQIVFATAETEVGGVAGYFSKQLWNLWTTILMAVSKLAIAVTIFALRMFINLAGYNNYIDTKTVHLGWLMIRDVANMFFVVVLLVIAFMTILGAGGYEWKKSMGKLIIAAIFINFSDLICGLIIDAAHVFTMTFLSAIVQAAGGNLIHMMSMDKVFQMSSGTDLALGNLRVEAFVAGLVMLFFTVTAAYTIGAYLIVMVARVVVLWALIILSPLAFLFQAIPKGEKYASEWWSEFINHVLAAPVMVFFLWLSFATLGHGNVLRDDINVGMPANIPKVSDTFDTGSVNNLSLSDVSSWENIANFLIAIAFLKVGIKAVGKLNVEGGQFTQGAFKFAKNVATIATGVGLAQSARKKASDLGVKAGKGIGSYALKKTGVTPFIDGKKSQLSQWRNKKKQAGAARAADIEKNLAKSEGESGAIKGTLSRTWARTKAMIYSPADRADKKSEDWKKAAENVEEVYKQNLKTSHTLGGRVKVATTIELEAQEKVGEGKKAQKTQQMKTALTAFQEGTSRDELIATYGSEKDADEVLAEIEKLRGEFGEQGLQDLAESYGAKKVVAVDAKLAGETAHRRREALSGETALSEREEQEMARIQHDKDMDALPSKDRMARVQADLEDKLSTAQLPLEEQRKIDMLQQEHKLAMKRAKSEEEVAKENMKYKHTLEMLNAKIQHDSAIREAPNAAARENIEEEYWKEKTIKQAEARAEKLELGGEHALAESVMSEAYKAVAKKVTDRTATLGWGQKVNLAGQMSTSVGKDNNGKPLPNGGINNEALKRNLGFMTQLYSSGEETARPAMANARDAIKWKEDINDENRLRADMSVILGRVIGKNEDMKGVLASVNDSFSDENERNAVMRLLDEATKHAASEGYATASGLVRDVYNGSTGKTEYRLGSTSKDNTPLYEKDSNDNDIVKKDSQGNDVKVIKRRGTAYSGHNADLRQSKNAAGFATTSASGDIKTFEEQNARDFAQQVKGKNSLFMSQIQSAFYASLNDVDVNAATDSEKAGLLKMFEEVAQSVKDEEAFAAFASGADELFEGLNGDKDFKKYFEGIRPSSPPTPPPTPTASSTNRGGVIPPHTRPPRP